MYSIYIGNTLCLPISIDPSSSLLFFLNIFCALHSTWEMVQMIFNDSYKTNVTWRQGYGL
jgi:hypothetical protein